MKYLDSLNLLKSSFLGGTEVRIISNILNEQYKDRDRVSLLDVGIGDGQSLRRILGGMNSSITIRITGVDPVLADSNEAKNILPDAELVATEFEKYVTDQKFDIVNVRQSLYYIHEKEFALQKMMELLTGEGILVITNWSKKDIFNRLHHELFPDLRQSISGEEIIDLLIKNNLHKELKTIRYEGQVDIALWKQSHAMLEAAVTIIARHNIDSAEMPSIVTKLRSAIQKLSDKESRVNLVICAKK